MQYIIKYKEVIPSASDNIGFHHRWTVLKRPLDTVKDGYTEHSTWISSTY